MENLNSAYDPTAVEGKWYGHWRSMGYFKPVAPEDAAGRAPFTVILPPPNVTGRLHMGHALTATVQDCLVRWRRMCGAPALWIPGTDHAGISTQVMVERQLMKEGTSREAIGRAAFLDRVWAWKEEHGGIIDRQHELLGASLDWDRYRFTLDEVSSRAVREAFCRLHDEGLIYRAYRLINWDWASQTALSDLEVEHREVGMKGQFKRADRLGARFALALGDAELASGQGALKDMQARSEVTADLGDAAAIYSTIAKRTSP